MPKTNLPCGHSSKHDSDSITYFGDYAECRHPQHTKEERAKKRYEWVPAHWREIIPKSKSEQNTESGETAEVEHAAEKERSIRDRVLHPLQH